MSRGKTKFAMVLAARDDVETQLALDAEFERARAAAAAPDATAAVAFEARCAGAIQGHTRVLQSYFNSRVSERSQRCQERSIHLSRT